MINYRPLTNWPRGAIHKHCLLNRHFRFSCWGIGDLRFMIWLGSLARSNETHGTDAFLPELFLASNWPAAIFQCESVWITSCELLNMRKRFGDMSAFNVDNLDQRLQQNCLSFWSGSFFLHIHLKMSLFRDRIDCKAVRMLLSANNLQL